MGGLNVYVWVDSATPSLLAGHDTSQAQFIIPGLGSVSVPNYWKYYSRVSAFEPATTDVPFGALFSPLYLLNQPSLIFAMLALPTS